MGKALTVKESPTSDRPRERLMKFGAETLRSAELLAILIRSGRSGESATQAGERLAAAYGKSWHQLALAAPAELQEISIAIGRTAYCQIMAGIELGRRLAAVNETDTVAKILSSADAMHFCQRRFARLAAEGKQEEFHIVTLDTKNQVIHEHQITVGTLDASLVHPREVFRPAIKDAAASILLVHNHPSGDPTPSKEDRAVTERLRAAGKLLGIDVLDHVIVTSQSATSLAELGSED